MEQGGGMNIATLHGKSAPALAFLIFPVLLLAHGLTYAAVSGPCVNCHTMHNSQDGSPIAHAGANVGWGVGGLTGTVSAEPLAQLLVSDCVGCHTSTTTSTIVNYGGSTIPIVYNTVVPSDPLAGGNFYWVAQGGAANDAKGHNVYGITGSDANLTEAPGRNTGAMCSNNCHDTLAAPPAPGLTDGNMNRGGCRGCHIYTAHHDDTRLWYRFLKGHGNWTATSINDPDYVLKTTSNEDPDWEQETTGDHNKYKGVQAAYNSDGTGLRTQKSISAFCSGCHARFHNTADINSGGSYTNPWLRHPTDIALPNADEYAGYDPVSNYSAEAPVAWTNPEDTSNRSTAVVMCLSCHRVHGSDQPDLLRWDYSTMEPGSALTNGCFTCHTTKN
jgi:predicted CXXCH cytochrome family protein